MKKEINYSICLLKVLAMFLIINSHSDALFPSKLSFFATGGAIGNGLFFLISGYLFRIKGNLFAQIINRIKRLYVPTYIITLLLIILGKIPEERLRVIHLFIWPTEYWFVSSLLVFSIILIISGKSDLYRNRLKFGLFTLLLLLFNIIVYIFFVTGKETWIVEDFRLPGEIPFKIIYCFFSFSLGYYLKNISLSNNYSTKKKVVNLIVSLLFFAGFKALLKKAVIPMQLQIISQLVTVYVVYWVFVCVMDSEMINAWLTKRKKLSGVLYKASTLTLEAYLLQFVIIDIVSQRKMLFPLNYVVSTILIILFAIAFHVLLEVLFHALDRLSFNNRKV